VAQNEKPDNHPDRSSPEYQAADLPIDSNTTILTRSRRQLLRRILDDDQPRGTTTLGNKHEVVLVIRGLVERAVLEEDKPLLLGRHEVGSTSEGIDLGTYGGADRGVSRIHAQLHVSGDSLYVTDLGSTNGTFLAGKRLEPDAPTLLHRGDELLLGRLAVQVLFRN
jgi:hypothetical protein